VIEIDGVPVKPDATVALAAFPVQLADEPEVFAALAGMSAETRALKAAVAAAPDVGPASTVFAAGVSLRSATDG
jgi:hypothetical protein